MNIEQLRRSLKTQWLSYYQENRSWLTKLGIWVNCEGQRRPSSSFILAALSTLEPQLTQVLPLVVDLSSNPDRIVIALGLNFNPDDELEALAEIEPATIEAMKMLPASSYMSLPDLSHTVEQRSPVIQPPVIRPVVATPNLPREAASRDPKGSKSGVSQPEPFNAQSQVEPSSPPANSYQANLSKPSYSQSASIKSAPIKSDSSKPDLSKPDLSKPNSAKPDLSKPDLSKSNSAQSNQPASFEGRSPTCRPPMDTAELSSGQLPERT